MKMYYKTVNIIYSYVNSSIENVYNVCDCYSRLIIIVMGASFLILKIYIFFLKYNYQTLHLSAGFVE